MKRATQIKVIVFTVVMLLVAAGLIITFGEFRFGSGKRYHAMFSTASDLRSGQKVRIAGVPVGRVKNVSLNRDNSVEVTFDVDSKYQLYSSSRAIIRYENLVGDRYLEITAGPGELHKLPDGGTLDKEHTQPALDLDALLGGLRPVLKGFDAAKVNEISNAFIQILQGQGGTLSQLLGDTSSFTSGLAERDQLIGDVINHLNEVLATVDSKSTQFSSSVDQLQQLIRDWRNSAMWSPVHCRRSLRRLHRWSRCSRTPGRTSRAPSSRPANWPRGLMSARPTSTSS